MNRRKPIHNLKPLENNRKQLRKRLTAAEAFLWNELKNQQFHGLKIRRQHSIKNYIVDFYCAQHKLIIELDGNYHDEPLQQEKDEARDQELIDMDLTIMRYENTYIFEELDHVLEDIKKHCAIE
ncbi:endonuclease domain-containing protein [Nonlabens sp. Ci31]|jgi:very-short-patch-repair endonuclease|uniref:endonuclease domain-containing protein n=1 Tax=Nonlabens sp. Ci31 TaxID=2608253 RepID=UPI001463D5B4|nr:endonuclease domain-containing protein [Nonlabens sp. Ci31]QJP33550.1 endonuclease domain-containing protein [Nonlabens sp. Ci31]QJP33551.1 endonuclease domain-containing protein [Nonlabens sp. Ci31]